MQLFILRASTSTLSQLIDGALRIECCIAFETSIQIAHSVHRTNLTRIGSKKQGNAVNNKQYKLTSLQKKVIRKFRNVLNNNFHK